MKELYYYLIGLTEPWAISDVKFDTESQRVDIWVTHQSKQCECPQCKGSHPIYDHVKERTWRHLDSCGYKTYIHAQIPRANCTIHGIHQVGIPWAQAHSRFTLMFERLAIDILKQCTIKGAAKILRISWDQAWHIMDLCVKRGLLRKENKSISYLGVDEKSVKKGHDYFTIVYNFDAGTVDYIGDDRKADSLKKYFDSLSIAQKSDIKAIAMDMWHPYIQAATEVIGDNKIVIDRFHIMKHMNKAVDDVRKEESKELQAKGDHILKRTKYMWLYGEENLPQGKKVEFEKLKHMMLKVAKAWSVKEMLRELWNCIDVKAAAKYFLNWLNWAINSRLKPIKKAADTFLNHIYHILTYFKNRITNSGAEGLNSKIQKIKAMACGFRNRENFKTAIYFHCGGLELYP